MNKSILILLFFIVFHVTGMAQNGDLKYKVVYESVLNGTESKAYAILRDYQKQDPFHANTYFHLGNISLNFTKKFDPLREFSDLSYFTYHTKVYYDLALKYIDEKEVKKNWEYYHQIKPMEGNRKVEYSQVIEYINSKQEELNVFEKNIEFIRKNYFASVRFYSNCLVGFKSIVDKNNKLKDIYLTANDDLIKDIKNVGTNFDSTLYYFDIYKEAIANFPIQNYNQNYTLDSIEIYRLDGLTKSNFLENEIVLWNYKQWSDSVLAVLDTDISKLRKDIDEEDKKIESLFETLNNTTNYSSKIDYYTIDQAFAYRLGRYDFQPLVLDIFNYKSSLLNFEIESKRPINNTVQVGDSIVNLHQKLLFYKKLINKKQIADKQLMALKLNLTPFSIQKYSAFIRANYKNEKGLNTYISYEPKKLDKILDESLSNLKNNVAITVLNKYINPNKLVKGDIQIPFMQRKDPLTGKIKNIYYTSSIAKNSNGDNFLTGYYRPKGKNTQAFVAMSDSLLNVNWIKMLDFSPKGTAQVSNFGSLICTTDEGCIAIIHTRDTIGGDTIIQNWVVRYTNKGNEITKDSIGPNLVPRLMFFDDINEKIYAAYKGTKRIENSGTLDTTIIAYSDSSGNSIWKTSLTFNGDLVDIIRSNENVIVTANYTEILNLGEMSTVPNGNTNAFSVFINESGEITNLKKYTEDYSFYLTHALKLDSETLNLLGFKSNEPNVYKILNDKQVKLHYLLIDTQGNIDFKY